MTIEYVEHLIGTWWWVALMFLIVCAIGHYKYVWYKYDRERERRRKALNEQMTHRIKQTFNGDL